MVQTVGMLRGKKRTAVMEFPVYSRALGGNYD